jgi:hypothetical protein
MKCRIEGGRWCLEKAARVLMGMKEHFQTVVQLGIAGARLPQKLCALY